MTNPEINPHVKEKRVEVRVKENVKKNLGNPLPNVDKRMIVDGVHHSMRKFDDIDTYKVEEGGLDRYITILRSEVRRHYVEEKKIEDNLEDDNPILEFINDAVKKIIIKKAKITH